MTHLPRWTWLLGAATLVVGACTRSLRYESDLTTLMQEIRAENVRANVVRDSVLREKAGVVRVSGSGEQLSLSVNLAQAELAGVLKRALDESKLPYVIEDHGPAGRTSARFENKPFLEGLNILLGREGFRARMREGIVWVHPSAIAMPDSSYHADEVIQREVRLDHLDDKATNAIVEKFLNAGAVKAQYESARARVLLQGARKDVYEAIAMLHRADRPVRHVLIEALVVQFDEATLNSLGIDWAQGQTGRFNGMSFTPGSDPTKTGVFTYTAADGIKRPLEFTATVQAVAGADKARIIARPFITARSGEQATVSIKDSRYYQTPVFANGATVTQLQSIETGVTLTITPTALNDERVRVELSINESQFLSGTTGNVTATTAKNEVTSSMQVPTGQTIIIGGLALDKQTRSSAGVPWIYRVPLLNRFFSHETDSRANSEVVIFLTPRIWTPDIDLPFARPDLFTIDTTVTAPSKKP